MCSHLIQSFVAASLPSCSKAKITLLDTGVFSNLCALIFDVDTANPKSLTDQASHRTASLCVMRQSRRARLATHIKAILPNLSNEHAA